VFCAAWRRGGLLRGDVFTLAYASLRAALETKKKNTLWRVLFWQTLGKGRGFCCTAARVALKAPGVIIIYLPSTRRLAMVYRSWGRGRGCWLLVECRVGVGLTRPRVYAHVCWCPAKSVRTYIPQTRPPFGITQYNTNFRRSNYSISVLLALKIRYRQGEPGRSCLGRRPVNSTQGTAAA